MSAIGEPLKVIENEPDLIPVWPTPLPADEPMADPALIPVDPIKVPERVGVLAR